MKTVNRICQILAIALGAASVALFFFPLVKFILGDASASATGAQLAFGSDFELAGKTYNLESSSKLAFCLIVTALGFVMSCFSFKKKGLRYAAPVFGLVSGIFMLVVALGNETSYIDSREEEFKVISGLSLEYETLMIFVPIAILLFVVFSAAYLLIDDYIEVSQSKGAKKTIFKRIIAFFRDYKSEVKKIVWPGLKDVLKNTAIVLVLCLLVGALIWLIDWGLGELLKVIWG